MTGAHDATADTLASVRVAQEVANRLHLTFDELIEDLNEPQPYETMPFGKYHMVPLDKLPRGWATYMNSIDDLSPDLQATVDYVLANN